MQRRLICHECGKAIPAEYVMWTKDGKGNMVPVHRDCSFHVYRADETWRYSRKRKKRTTKKKKNKTAQGRILSGSAVAPNHYINYK